MKCLEAVTSYHQKLFVGEYTNINYNEGVIVILMDRDYQISLILEKVPLIRLVDLNTQKYEYSLEGNEIVKLVIGT